MPRPSDPGPPPDTRKPRVIYKTALGEQRVGDSLNLLAKLPKESVDLIVTSPPFALLREKAYGNKSQTEYVEWLAKFGQAAKRVLKTTGSLVIELGGAYQQGRPVRSIYNYRVLVEFCDTLDYRLAEEFFWYNPAKLPSPIEWVNKRKIRAKDSVSPIWWFSVADEPKADIRRVLVEYSSSMKELLEDPDAYYQPKTRPSEHQIGKAFAKDNGGAIPSNLLQYSNTESTSPYLRACKLLAQDPHPARFPAGLPRFFIRFLTQPGDLVVDIFSGSNVTGRVAEAEGRRWVSCELDLGHARLSSVRFMDGWSDERIRAAWETLSEGRVLTIAPISAAVTPAPVSAPALESATAPA